MTRMEALERRKQLAVALSRIKNVNDVAEQFHVSPSLVRKAWREFGGRITPERANLRVAPREEVVASLRVGTKLADVAKHYGVSEGQIVKIQDRVSSGRG